MSDQIDETNPSDDAPVEDSGRRQQPGEGHETVNRESHPNAAGPEGLTGDLGISSERSGPFEGVEGTGSLVSAQHTTDGEATELSDEAPSTGVEEVPDKPDDSAKVSDVDRTVGEVQPDPVVNKHQFDPSRNPRH